VQPTPAAAASGPKTKDQKRAEAEARNRAHRATRDAKSRLDKCEKELHAAQARHDELVARMAEPEFYANAAEFESAMAEYAELKSRIPALEEEWLELSEAVARATEDASRDHR
jgi:ATP-binding cassette subfamily F protein 3